MSDIKRVFIGGVIYTAIARYSGVVINLIVTAILSRLLTPNDFGIVAIAMVFITLFSILSDIGIGSAIVQKKELTNKDISSIFSATIYIAIFFAVIFFFCGNIISLFYEESILKNICRILSIHLFFSICNIVPNGLLMRDKKFQFIAIRSLIIQLSTGAIAVICAFTNCGIYALLVSPILSSVLIFIINYIQYYIPFSFKISILSIRKIFSYSIFQFLFSFVNYFSRNLDNLLIGKYMSMNHLGYYEKSYRFMQLPMSYITHILTPVIHPVFSDYQNDTNRITEMYSKIVRLLAFIGFPLSAFLFFNAKELILLIFGNQWNESIFIFQLLAISVGFQMVSSSTGAIFQAANATKLLFIDGLLSTALILTGLLVGLFIFNDINIIAFGISMAYIVNFFKTFYILFIYVLRKRVSIFYSQLLMPIILGGSLAIILFLFQTFVEANMILAFVLKGLISAVYVVSFIHIFKIYDLYNFIRKNVFRKK